MADAVAVAVAVTVAAAAIVVIGGRDDGIGSDAVGDSDVCVSNSISMFKSLFITK